MIDTTQPFVGRRRLPAGDERSVLVLSLLAGAATALLLRPARDRLLLVGGDAERRRIERDLHDGAQQQLVALAVKLRLIQRIGETDVERALGMLDEARADVLATVEEVRALAHGIHPPLLTDRGLGEALRAAADRAALPTTVEAGRVGRFREEVEAAVYFCCVEALQNAGKHAGPGATAEVRLEADEDWLRFEVRDDGAGFGPPAATGGRGLRNMADRLAAVRGSIEVWSLPGHGTRITGRIRRAGSLG